MKIIPTAIPDVLIIEPKVFGDDRGFFFESYNRKQFAEKTGRDVDFVQDNHCAIRARACCAGFTIRSSRPRENWCGSYKERSTTWRWISANLHPPFGKWVAETLSAENKRMLVDSPKVSGMDSW